MRQKKCYISKMMFWANFSPNNGELKILEGFYLAKFSLKYFDWSNMSNILSCARESVFVILWQTTVTSTDDKVFEKYIFSQNLRHWILCIIKQDNQLIVDSYSGKFNNHSFPIYLRSKADCYVSVDKLSLMNMTAEKN